MGQLEPVHSWHSHINNGNIKRRDAIVDLPQKFDGTLSVNGANAWHSPGRNFMTEYGAVGLVVVNDKDAVVFQLLFCVEKWCLLIR